MKTVRHILQSKEIEGVLTIKPLATVYEAIALMSAHSIAALAVVEGSRLVGMISERDCVQKVALREMPLRKTRVYEVLDDKVRCFSLDTSVDECMQYMTLEKKRHVPVIHHGRLIGLVSIGDVVNQMLAKQAFTIDQLQTYIVS